MARSHVGATNTESKSGCAADPEAIAPAHPATPTTHTAASSRPADTFNRDPHSSPTRRSPDRGSVSWKLYSNKSCDASEGGLVASEGPVAVDGDGEYSTPQGQSPTQAGTYY